jgi:polyferredoxin
MDRIGRPLNLIALDTERNQQRRRVGELPTTRIIRPRTLIYSAILVLIGSGILIGLSARTEVEVNVLRDRNPLFVKLADGSIRNGYTIKISNKSREPRLYDLTMSGIEGATLAVVGQDVEGLDRSHLAAGPDTVTSHRIYVTAPAAALSGESMPLILTLNAQPTGAVADYEAVFRGPAR